MNIRVALFASARDLAGTSSLEIDLPSESSIEDLRLEIVGRHPELTEIVSASLFAVDQKYAGEDEIIRVGQEVALIPPVSGG